MIFWPKTFEWLQFYIVENTVSQISSLLLLCMPFSTTYFTVKSLIRQVIHNDTWFRNFRFHFFRLTPIVGRFLNILSKHFSSGLKSVISVVVRGLSTETPNGEVVTDENKGWSHNGYWVRLQLNDGIFKQQICVRYNVGGNWESGVTSNVYQGLKKNWKKG